MEGESEVKDARDMAGRKPNMWEAPGEPPSIPIAVHRT